MIKTVLLLVLILIVHCYINPSTHMSERILSTENPYIEDVLDKYSATPDLIMLALGSSYWTPPKESLEKLLLDMQSVETHRYGSILGLMPLRDGLKSMLSRKGLNTIDLEVAVTAGANQAFMNAALAICDDKDNAIIMTPYYFSHKLSLQLCGVNIHLCAFHTETLGPNWSQFEALMKEHKPKMVVVTTPNNPSGYVWTAHDIEHIINICKTFNTWIVFDQTYFEFLYDDTIHTFPCGKKYDYHQIIHIFSLSKSFGMPGWRIGYLLYPTTLSTSFRKIQDTIPTHASIISQKLAIYCLDTYSTDDHATNDWVANNIASLQVVRDILYDKVLHAMGTVKSTGAFYFLVPVPHVHDEEAVDILATRFGILLMPGTAFGAPNFMRLSYGRMTPDLAMEAANRLINGNSYLLELSKSREADESS